MKVYHLEYNTPQVELLSIHSKFRSGHCPDGSGTTEKEEGVRTGMTVQEKDDSFRKRGPRETNMTRTECVRGGTDLW